MCDVINELDDPKRHIYIENHAEDVFFFENISSPLCKILHSCDSSKLKFPAVSFHLRSSRLQHETGRRKKSENFRILCVIYVVVIVVPSHWNQKKILLFSRKDSN
jgi:hypothetical protein